MPVIPMKSKGESYRRVPGNGTSPNSASKSVDAEARRLAKELHDLKYIYALYGALDGLSLSYSMVKYVFDLMYTNTKFSSSDVMHDWMATTEGAISAASISLTLIAFSYIGNVYDDKNPNRFKRYLAIAWPYFRDAMKGLKNAYKGVRGTLQALSMFTGQDLRYMIVPVGLLLGVFAALNRICMRKYVVEPRKNMTINNTDLLEEIQSTALYFLPDADIPGDRKSYRNSYILVNKKLYYVHSNESVEEVTLRDSKKFFDDLLLINEKNEEKIYLSDELVQDLITANGGHSPPIAGFDQEACEAFRKRKQGQSPEFQRRQKLAYLGAAYGGFVDGLYLYMGALSLAALTPSAFMVMTAFCVIFSLSSIVTRVYEEYFFQQKLSATQAKIDLMLCGKELESMFTTLQRLSNPLLTLVRPGLENEQKALVRKIEEKNKDLERIRDTLRLQITLSKTSAALAGLRDGLYAYGVISSVMFAVATIGVIFMTPFPAAFLIAGMSAGIACLIGLIAHSMIHTYFHQPEQKKHETAENLKLLVFWANLKNKTEEVLQEARNPKNVKDAIRGGMVVDPSPQFFFQEWFEVARSFFSGLAKGQKSVDFVLPLQESEAQGHYHETPVMFWATLISASFYAGVLALRAFARGFGRPPIDTVKVKTLPPTPPGAGATQGAQAPGPTPFAQPDIPYDGESRDPSHQKRFKQGETTKAARTQSDFRQYDRLPPTSSSRFRFNFSSHAGTPVPKQKIFRSLSTDDIRSPSRSLLEMFASPTQPAVVHGEGQKTTDVPSF